MMDVYCVVLIFQHLQSYDEDKITVTGPSLCESLLSYFYVSVIYAVAISFTGSSKTRIAVAPFVALLLGFFMLLVVYQGTIFLTLQHKTPRFMNVLSCQC